MYIIDLSSCNARENAEDCEKKLTDIVSRGHKRRLPSQLLMEKRSISQNSVFFMTCDFYLTLGSVDVDLLITFFILYQVA